MERKVTIYEVNDGVAVVTLNRPDRLNAWTGRMELEYRHAMAEADRDPAVRVIVVTGAGRGFCAGADLKALDRIAGTGAYDPGTPEERPEPGAGVRSDFEQAHTFPFGMRKPVIAAVNGPAAGVGFVLMCMADIRIAAAGVKLTTSFARLGLPAEHGVSWVLSRLVGPARAADLLFSSRVVLSEEAAAMGLVNRVVPGAELMDHVLDYAARMASEVSPASLETMKRQLYADWFRPLGEAATDAYDLMEKMVGEADFAEGVRAFSEGRPPAFSPLPPT